MVFAFPEHPEQDFIKRVIVIPGDKLEARHTASAQTKASAGAGVERVIPNPTSAPHAAGRGTPVGQVYRLPDGRLVYVRGDSPRR